jgi:uncharacterized membrane protein
MNGIVFLGIGFELVAMCVGGFYLGQAIDDHYGWKSIASTYLVLVLLVAWFVHLFYLLRKFEKENDDGSGGPKP